MSNGPPRATAPDDSNGWPSVQLKFDLRREIDGPVRSPASPYHGPGSGHSTPLQTSVAPAADMATKEQRENSNASASKTLLTALQNFAFHVATRASLEMTARHAEQAYQRAKEEYSGLRSHYSKFPALEEKKGQSRGRAYGHYMNVKKEMESLAASQESDVVDHLAKLITSVSTNDGAKPYAERMRTDTMSRAQVDALSKKHDELRRQHNSMSTALNTIQDRFNSREVGLAEVQRVANEAADTAAASVKGWNETSKAATEAVKLAKSASSHAAEMAMKLNKVDGRVHDVFKLSHDTKSGLETATELVNKTKEAANESLRVARNAQTVSGQVSGFQNQCTKMSNDIDRLDNLWKQRSPPSQRQQDRRASDEATAKIEAVHDELQIHKADSAGKFALKKDVGDLEARCDTLTQDVSGVRKGNFTLSKELEQIKASSRPASAKGQRKEGDGMDADFKSRLERLWSHEIWTDGPRLVKQVDAQEKAIAKIQALTFGESEQSFESVRDNFGNLRGWLVNLDQALQELRDGLRTLAEGVNDAGNGTIKQRFKTLDRAVNNVSSKVGGNEKTTIDQRVQEVENQLRALQSSRPAKSGPAGGPSESSMEEGEIRSQEPATHKNTQEGGLISRVPELEQKYDALRVELDGLKGSIRVDSPSGHVTLSPNAADRLTALETEVESLNKEATEKDAIVMAEIEAKHASMNSALSDNVKHHKEEVMRLEQLMTLTKTRIVQAENLMKTAVTKEAFEAFEKQSIHPMRKGFYELQSQVKDIQTAPKHQRQNSMPAPQMVPSQSPQMPNGTSSPQINGIPQRVPTPQDQSAQPPVTAQDIAQIHDRVDGILAAQQHLKRRADNMTSDDIVMSMCDQFSTMYPDAKNFNSAHKALMKRADALEVETRALKQAQAVQQQEMHILRQRAEKLERAVREAESVTKKLEQELAGVKATTDPLSKTSAVSAFAGAGGLQQKDLQPLRDRVADATRTANTANNLAKGHSARFSNLDCEATKKKVDELDSAVKKMEGEMGRVKTDMEAYGEALAERGAAVKALEKKVREGS